MTKMTKAVKSSMTMTLLSLFGDQHRSKTEDDYYTVPSYVEVHSV